MPQCSSGRRRSSCSRIFGRTSWFLSLPYPRNMREAVTAYHADGWMEAMDKEMANLKSHDGYELAPRVKGLRTLKLGWACAGRSNSTHKNFAAGGFWMNKFIGLGSEKEIDAWANSVDARYGITGLGSKCC